MPLTAFLRANNSRILHEWEEFAARLSDGASLPRWILRDHAAAILAFIAEYLERFQPASPPIPGKLEADPVSQVVAAHVNVRIDSGFDLAQIVAEYCALRACAVRLWQQDEPAQFAAGAAEITRFDQIVDEHITAAVVFYKRNETQYRDRFLGMLGHDLRNPINAILTTCEALAQQGLNEQQLKALARIQKSTRSLIGMTNDILDFTRGRLGSPMPILMSAANLGIVVREVVDEVQAAHPACAIDFTAEGDLNGGWDTGRLKQMIANLVVNAIQHGTGGHVEVKVKSDETVVVLEVHNDGPVIPAERLATIFDPFVGGSQERHVNNGLGLGLFIVNEIVTAHKGVIAISSTDKDGTTFVVRLPRRSA